MAQKYIVAIEISGTQVKGALATRCDTPAIPEIDAIIAEDNHDSVQYGRIDNVINATNHTRVVLQKLAELPAIADGTITGCYVALAGRSFASVKTTAQIDLATEMMISSDIITRLYEAASKNAPIKKQVIKVLPRKFYVDDRAQINPIGSMGRKLRGDFTLVVADKVNHRNLDMVMDNCNIKEIEYIPAPLALANMVLTEEQKHLGCMLVDVGAQTTTISIYKDGSLQYLVTLPMGSLNITHDIAVGMNYFMDKAEVMKCAQGNAMPDTNRPADESARANNYVAARAFELVANIVANINYAGYKPQDLGGGIVLAGRGSRLRNFDKLLEYNSKMTVSHAELPAAMTFAFNTATTHPSDYMSLLAIVNYVARRTKIIDCVDFNTISESTDDDVIVEIPEISVEVETPVREPRKPAETKTEKPRATRTGVKPMINPFADDDDDTLLDDEPPVEAEEPDVEASAIEPDHDVAPTPQKSRSFIDRVKYGVAQLFSDDEMDEDSKL